MRKLLSMMLIMASFVCFTSCSDDDEEKSPSIPATYDMLVGESFSLNFKNKWNSSNTFVATVDENGVVKAERKGTARIYSGDNKYSCMISVSPSYTLYDDPITDWGISKNSLKSKRGTPDSENSTSLSYKTNKSYAPIELYLFENNRLQSAGVIVSTSYTDEMLEHLNQRYKAVSVDVDDYYVYYIDAKNLSDAETVIIAQLYNYSYWIVGYMKYTDTKSSIQRDFSLNPLMSELDKLNGDFIPLK